MTKLEISDEAAERLTRLAGREGRSPSEIVTALVDLAQSHPVLTARLHDVRQGDAVAGPAQQAISEHAVREALTQSFGAWRDLGVEDGVAFQRRLRDEW